MLSTRTNFCSKPILHKSFETDQVIMTHDVAAVYDSKKIDLIGCLAEEIRQSGSFHLL